MRRERERDTYSAAEEKQRKGEGICGGEERGGLACRRSESIRGCPEGPIDTSLASHD